MTPNTRAILIDLAQRMGGVYAPDLKSSYLAGSAGLTAAVLMMAAEEGDRTAHRLVEENRAIRVILKAAAGLPPPADLTERLHNLAGGEDSDLRISALQGVNDALRNALTDLHAAVETTPGETAAALNTAIWSELSASTRRRAFASQSF